MTEIIMIQTDQLYHHPENPRLELGDLTELTESIRQNGVMQNLTVIPGHRMTKEEWVKEARAEGADKVSAEASYRPADAWTGEGYTVVIGNRRMEASKLAGLEAVPCVISDMDHKTQISTMLEENMQRSDLTVYEQAQGFQMMMDLGYTAKDISERTGFSETTVSRRLKMAELDKKKFKQAVRNQITMDVLDKLGQIEDLKKRNELLSEFGENNFDWKLNRAIKVQKASKVKPKALAMLEEAKIEKLPDKEKYSYGKYRDLYSDTCELDKWDGKRKFIPKLDAEHDEKILYSMDETDITFYAKPKKAKGETNRRSPEEIAEEKRITLAWKTAERASETATELRRAYVKGMKVSPKNAMEMLQWAMLAAMASMLTYNTPTQELKKKVPITSYHTDEIIEQVRKWIMEMPQSGWPDVILMFFEGDEQPHKIGYYDGSKYLMPKHKTNRNMDLCYEWLTQFGYQMSDEEIQMMSGQHSCFQKEAEK